MALTDSEFKSIANNVWFKGQSDSAGRADKPIDVLYSIDAKLDAVIAALAALPAQIPVTVQGASEDFINSSLGQVLVNSNANTNFLGASILNRRTEIINRINETHPR